MADKMGGNDIKVGGTYPQRMSSVLETLKKVMLEDHAVVMSYVPAEKSANSDDREDEKEMTPLESVMKVIGMPFKIFSTNNCCKYTEKYY